MIYKLRDWEVGGEIEGISPRFMVAKIFYLHKLFSSVRQVGSCHHIKTVRVSHRDPFKNSHVIYE